MAIYLNEEQFGRDRDTIGFPNVQMCMALVVVTRSWLYGLHLSWVDDTPALARALAAYVRGHKSQPLALYGSCNFVKRYNGGGIQAWAAEMTVAARELAYDGPAFGFDTADIPPKPGTYVQYERKPNQDRCRILYTQSTNMVHPSGEPARHHFWANRNTGASTRSEFGPTGAQIQEGQLRVLNEQYQILQYDLHGA